MWQIVQIVSICVSGILALYAKNKWKELKLKDRLLTFSLAITAIATAIVSIEKVKIERTVERINAKYGDFTDIFGARLPIMQIGYTGSTIILQSPVFSFTQEADNLMRVYLQDGKLKLDVVIRDPKGEVIAAIEGNTWTVFSDDYEYNDDKQAFEIVTKGERNVYFQIDLQKGVAHVSGILINEKGWGIHIFDTEDFNDQWNTRVAIIDISKGFKPGKAISKIFKYPRGMHYGRRVNE